jgi:hypothetical protein
MLILVNWRHERRGIAKLTYGIAAATMGRTRLTKRTF